MPNYRLRTSEVTAFQFTGEVPTPDGRLDFPAGEVYLLDGRAAVNVSGGLSVDLDPGDWVVTAPDGAVAVFTDDQFRLYYEPLPADGKSEVPVSGVWLRTAPHGKVSVLVEVNGVWRVAVEDCEVYCEDGLPYVVSHIAEARGFAAKPLDPITQPRGE